VDLPAAYGPPKYGKLRILALHSTFADCLVLRQLLSALRDLPIICIVFLLCGAMLYGCTGIAI